MSQTTVHSCDLCGKIGTPSQLRKVITLTHPSQKTKGGNPKKLCTLRVHPNNGYYDDGDLCASCHSKITRVVTKKVHEILEDA